MWVLRLTQDLVFNIMVGREGLGSEDLDSCFEKLLFGGGGIGGVKMRGGGGGVITEWKDIPMELLLRIVDDRTVIVASGVCTGWRDAICLGLTHLSLSWCKNDMNNLVLSLAPKFTKLQTLILRQDKPQLQDNAVETIANCCHDLQDLDLSKSFNAYRSLSLCLGSWLSKSFKTQHQWVFCLQKLKYLNLCGCVKAASDKALKAIGCNCSQLQSLNLGWCENVGDVGVKSLAYGCPDLRALDLCGCVLITDDSVIALANNCLHLRSLDLYYCRNITDKAMYSLARRRMTNKREMWESVKNRCVEEEGLINLNISQCTALTPPAVQAVCDSFPALHTCPGRHSLIISGCLNLTSVHCACAFQAHRAASALPPTH
ncbi:hypothetical protein HYC85_008006 [Camellia sinensis]|uniref:F-box/LRR-repeat protein 15-like leucin rich repeat domain-containing protein n=1 Tax=Camellia sinensis TaxID=4442 RepID=A0A7J7HQK4_CAMSI|nr:hypothetical protein HYC85_008006 [Camellia sinensis]